VTLTYAGEAFVGGNPHEAIARFGAANRLAPFEIGVRD
jgi:hypothetical protein